MAHDFGIRNTKNEEWAFFFGYANGLMYEAFDEQRHNAGFSGDGGKETRSWRLTERALSYAIGKFDRMGYPDPNRMDDIKEFYKKVRDDPHSDTYEIWYS